MKIILGIVMVSIVFITGCQRSEQLIDADEAIAMMEEDASIVLLDVRTLAEYDDSHIEGSVLIPLQTLEQEIAIEYPDVDTTFIIYCRTGNRSADALEIMEGLGYHNLYDLGGIVDWPYETISN